MSRTGIKTEEIIRIRVTKKQKVQFKKAAAKVGLELSTWMRHIAIKEVAK